MKRHLLATTALAGACLLALPDPAAGAEPVTMRLGGMMEQWVGWADQETHSGNDYNDFDQQQESKVFFLGDTKLDNGLGVAVEIVLLSDAGGTFGIEESFMELQSDTWGLVRLGRSDGMLKRTQILAPDVGIENTDGDYGNWIVAPSNFTDVGATFFEGSGASNKISYESPSFGGLQVVGGYAPGVNSGSATQPNSTTDYDAWEVGLVYQREIAGLAFAMDLGYGGTEHAPGTNPQDYFQAGASLGMGGFTLAGGWGRIIEGQDVSTTSSDGYVFDVGASYEWGPYGVSLTHFHSTTDGNVNVAGEDEKDSTMLSGAYALGPGITARGSMLWVDYDDETATAANNNDGWGAVGGLALEF